MQLGRPAATSSPKALAAMKAGEFTGDTVIVVRHQGPKANGMPELHALTPILAVLQDRGHKVALVTDGRMSGASGKVPAAIHVSPEAADGGPLSLLRDGDLLRLDAATGTHFYTASESEHASILATRPEMAQEGIAFYAPSIKG